MKILQLNVWGGRLKGAALDFLAKNQFDVVCMQEVMESEDQPVFVNHFFDRAEHYQKASELPHAYFSPNYSVEIANGAGEMKHGNLILSREEMVEKKTEFVNDEYIEKMIFESLPKNNMNVQIVRLKNGLTVVNHHGVWHNDPMGNELSVTTMRKVAELVKKVEGPLVMCGDLNLQAEAPAMRELDFLRNLTAENGVENTLNDEIRKRGLRVACDHILVNDLVKVKDFRVYEGVMMSDHLGLMAEIEI